jgi:hypothetical protein
VEMEDTEECRHEQRKPNETFCARRHHTCASDLQVACTRAGMSSECIATIGSLTMYGKI